MDVRRLPRHGRHHGPHPTGRLACRIAGALLLGTVAVDAALLLAVLATFWLWVFGAWFWLTR